jgi:homoserine kinase
MASFTIRVPCSSANIGPGFDVIGLALSLHLELHVTVDVTKPSSTAPLNCVITYEDLSGSLEQISLDPDVNLITRVALYVLRCHNQRTFPVETHVVAGVALGNEVGKLGLPRERLLDYCLMIGTDPFLSLMAPNPFAKHILPAFCLTNILERHPDNVAASLFGGFVGTYLNELKPEDMARIEIPLSEVLPSPAGGIDTGVRPPQPPENIGHLHKFTWAKEIKAVAIIPDFEVPTADARNVLPKSYSRADVVSDFIILGIPSLKPLWGYSNHQDYRSSICSVPHYSLSH